MLENFVRSLSLQPFVDLIQAGGPVVAILLVLSVFTTATIILKLIQFFWLGIGRHKRTDKAINAWLAGDRVTAYECVEGRRNPVDRTLAHLMRGIQKTGEKDLIVREDIERVGLSEMQKVRSHFRFIEAIVQVAPLLGLFGTVIGMIEAFRTLQGAGADANPAILAGGIWVALMTTAVGLAIAIPAALILYWFESLAQREENRLSSAVTSLLTNRITEGTSPTFSVVSNDTPGGKLQDHAA